MATPGPKPTPSAQATGEDKPAPGNATLDVRKPADLSPEGEELWDVIVPALRDMGALVESDLPMLVELVEALGLARAYRRRLAEVRQQDSVTEYDRNGHPYEVAPLDSKVVKRLRAGWKQAMDTAHKLAAEFGLTPSERMRMGLMQVQGESLAAALRGDE